MNNLLDYVTIFVIMLCASVGTMNMEHGQTGWALLQLGLGVANGSILLHKLHIYKTMALSISIKEWH